MSEYEYSEHPYERGSTGKLYPGILMNTFIEPKTDRALTRWIVLTTALLDLLGLPPAVRQPLWLHVPSLNVSVAWLVTGRSKS
jgi:hypothetical protein